MLNNEEKKRKGRGEGRMGRKVGDRKEWGEGREKNKNIFCVCV